MRSIPVKETAFEGFTCVMTPQAKLVDLDTGEVRKDRRSGQTVYVVGVCAMRGRDSSVIQVSVVGEPPGLVLGAPVRVVELEASPWDRDGRSGVAWRAAAIVPADLSPTGPPTGPATGERSGTRPASSPASGVSGRRLAGGEAG